MSSIGAFRNVTSGAALRARQTGWKLAALTGRLVEISGAEDSAALTFAFGLVREAQLAGEPAAWVTLLSQVFYPPDAAAGGIDLDALAVVRVKKTRDLARVADHLGRSGAFGLIVLDLGGDRPLPMAAQSRLLGLAQRHDFALVFLTQKAEQSASLGSLVSLRAQTTRRKTGSDEFTCELRAIKDKRRAPGWSHKEICRGPAGLH